MLDLFSENWRPVNVGEIILGEMVCTRFRRKIKRYFYGNLLTQYMLSREVPEYPGYNEVVEAPHGLMDIKALLDTTSKMSLVAQNEREENFNRYIYSSLNVIMRQLGVTDGERTQLCTELSGAMKEILEIAPVNPIHPYEDENTNKGSNDEGDVDDEVIGPMALVPLGEDDDEVGASGGGRFDDEGPEYDLEGSD